MNLPIKAPLDGEVIARPDVRLVGRNHPLVAGRIDIRIRAGQSIAEMLDEALAQCGPGSRLAPGLLVHVDGCPVERGWWHLIWPKPGTTVTFTPVPGNLRSVLMLAIAVAALVVAGPIAGFLGLTGVALTVGTALISTGIILGGTLAVNALFPIRALQHRAGGGFTALPSIQGARNQAAPFAPVPVVLGVHRLSPFLAGSYTELVGDDQYLRLLFVWGYGALDISDLKIGETPLSSFTDVQTQTNNGYLSDSPITLFPSSIHEDVLSIELTALGSGVVYGNIQWQSRTTAAGIDQFSVDITAPEGVYKLNLTTGNDDAFDTAPFAHVEYRAVGNVPWIAAGDITFPKSVKTARKGLIQSVTRGQYEVRLGRATAFDTGSDHKSRMIWTALRSIENDSPVNFAKPLAMTAMRIKATNQLNGTVDTFNGIVSSRAVSWNGASWVADTVSQNPADLIRLALQGPAGARPVADAQINLSNLQSFSAYCTAQGFTFNQVRTTATSVYDCVADIAAAGRGVPTFIDGQWGVIWDRPNDSVVQHFTPRNSWGFAGSRPYAHLPHAWRVKFINATNAYTQDERIVYDDGYNSANATLFEAIEFPGVTDPGLIWKHGRFHIAQVRLRPEDIQLSTGWENLVCTRGDRVYVTHDVLLIGQVSGRVKSIASQNVTFDEKVIIAAGKTYGVRFRSPDGANTSILRSVNMSGLALGETTVLPLIGDLTVLAAGYLFGFGETSADSAIYRVKSIVHQKDLIAQLTLVDDAQAISTVDSGVIPPYNPNITLPADPFAYPPQNLQYIEVIDLFGAQARSVVRLSWTYPTRIGRVASFEVQAKDVTHSGDWVIAASVSVPHTQTEIPSGPGQWSFRVRCLFNDGTVSAWAELDSIQLNGLLSAPADVTNLRRSHVDLTATITWDEVTDTRPLRYEIRKGVNWATALQVGDVAHPPYATVGDDTYWVGTYVGPIAGTTVYSVAPVDLLISGSVLTSNVIASFDEAALGWIGTFTGGAGVDGVDIRTGGSGDITTITDITTVTDILDFGGQQSGVYTIPVAHRVILSAPASCRVLIDYAGQGSPVGSDITAEADVTLDPDVTGSAASRFVNVYPEIRLSQNGVTWGAWQRFSPGIYTAMGFDSRMQLQTSDPDAIAYCTKYVFAVDVPDREDHFTNVAVDPAGTTFTYTAPFNGGPGSAITPNIGVDVRNAAASDTIVRSGETLSGFTLQITNAGVGVARNVDIRITGY